MRAAPSPLATTGIGSLPHTQLELALQQAFSLDIPYVPQLPRRDPAEYMIPQALAGLPGLRHDTEGNAAIDAAEWERGAAALGDGLNRALAGELATFAAWRPFLWEVESRRAPFAKAQIAGPTTARWVVTLDDGRRVEEVPDLDRAIYRILLARALSMVRAIRERGATPIFFFDEPGLYALDPKDPRHLVALQELRIAIAALKREGALAGLHCCGNTAWELLLGLGMDYLSLDVRLSLEAVLGAAPALRHFTEGGGCLALGIVPTNLGAEYDLGEVVALARAALVEIPLEKCLLSPACGLALRSIPDCERVFADLARAQQALRQ